MKMLAFTILFLLVGNSFGQIVTEQERKMREMDARKLSDPLPKNYPLFDRSRLEEIMKGRGAIDRLGMRVNDVTYQKNEKALNALRKPRAKDVGKFRNFLSQKQTGIFKLFPDLGCDGKFLVNMSGKCAGVVPSSWSYSFNYRDYAYLDLYDLKLKDNLLIAFGFLNQTILVPLGDVDISNVTLATNGIQFLSNFAPKLKSKEAKEQFAQIYQKNISDGFTYTKVVEPNVNATFGMRNIAYELSDQNKIAVFGEELITAQDRLNFYYLERFTRTDKILAFKIIRKDADGSLTIIWKELSEKKSPKLEFEKGEKLTDLKNQ